MSRGTALVANVVRKIEDDQFWLEGDKTKWYVDGTESVTEDIKAVFVQLFEDEETKRFISHSVEKSNSWLLQMYHSVGALFLAPFLTQTDINGYLQRGSMFVFSAHHFRTLLDKGGVQFQSSDKVGQSVIDIGAGDGAVTSTFKTFFDEVYATETSGQMRRRLDEKGIVVVDEINWHTTRKFDVVTCLNVIDRCDMPISLLNSIKEALADKGLLILAMVLPFKPFVEDNTQNDNKPTEMLPIREDTQLIDIVRIVTNLGFTLRSWTRLPYLCEGDLRQSLYVLDDYVFLFSLK